MTAILDWVRSHPVLDVLAAAAGAGVAAATLLAASCGMVYLALVLRRLASKEHVRVFLSRPIAPLRSAKVLGQELAFGAQVDRTHGTIAGLAHRVDILEDVLAGVAEELQHGTIQAEETQEEEPG